MVVIKYEYKRVHRSHFFDYIGYIHALNDIGQQGWELAAVTQTDILMTFWFKRPVQDTTVNANDSKQT